MKLFFYSFFMCWGMFLAIPNPVKIWDENARGRMLLCLPVVGLIPGAIWAALAAILPAIHTPAGIQSAILAACPWLVTGFIHLDGYMDVCDAVLSRRDLATRQKILKDSHCGAFAVICMVLLAMAAYAIGGSREKFSPGALLAIPVASRSCAAFAVMNLRRLGTSQYASLEKSSLSDRILLVAMAAFSCLLPLLFGAFSFAPVAAIVGYSLACAYGYRNLDGMSGDISGFALTVGELIGFAAAGIWG